MRRFLPARSRKSPDPMQSDSSPSSDMTSLQLNDVSGVHHPFSAQRCLRFSDVRSMSVSMVRQLEMFRTPPVGEKNVKKVVQETFSLRD